LLVVLHDAKTDPGRLLATPNTLLESQPALRQLKEGLVAAQIRTATLKGEMSEEHPKVKAAIETEEGISRNLHAELAIAIRGLEVENNLDKQRITMLNEQLAQNETRLKRLADLRATYAARLVEHQNRAAALSRAENDLAEARASLASAGAASLLTRIDDAQTGEKPAGPEKAVIVMAGIAGGMLLGFGILFLTVQPATSAPAVQPAPSVAVEPVETSGPTLLDWPTENVVLSLKQALRKVAAGVA
jgi:polysaccharide biosynthesis transport protein